MRVNLRATFCAVPNEATHAATARGPRLRGLLDAQRDQRIFVEFASVRASEVVATAASAIEHAVRPDRLRFGIAVLQSDNDRLLRERRSDPRFSIEFHPATTHASRQWMRHRAQSFYDGEPFTLQIGGDARFAPDWDVRYLELLAAVEVERPLLTDAPLPRTCPATRPPRPSGDLAQLAAHRFTVGRFAIDVPHDPDEHGNDDLRLAIRAYTHGYDSAFPAAPLVIRSGEERPPQPFDHPDDRTIATVARAFGRCPIGGTFGLGTRRSVAAFARLSQPS